MEKIYVFGHKRPDTDSVCASIAMAHLLNCVDEDVEATPRILGSINNETQFVLEHFGVKIPKYLNDVKVHVRDVNYLRDFYIDKCDTIKNAYDLMITEQTSAIPIVDIKNNRQLVGLITLKELAKELVDGNRKKIHTSYDNLLKVLDGKELIRHDDEIDGNVLTATFRSTTFLHDVELRSDTILVVGDRHSILEYAIESGVKLIILVGNSEIKAEHLTAALKKHINIIRTTKDSFEVSNILSLANYTTTISSQNPPVTIRENDYLTDFEEIYSKLAYSNYPVISNDNQCLGLIKITDVNDKKRKKVVLVDHNEKDQSADGLEEAEIMEIIDHHRLGMFSTSSPINFRNMSVGSTCTIIHSLYEQYGIAIPREIAGLLLSAILSDTLLLKSPTTTNIDIAAVQKLADQLDIEYEQYGLEMFKRGSSLQDKTIEEIIYQDFKQFIAEDKKIGIGQVFTINYDEIDVKRDEFVKTINEQAQNNNYDIICLFITDIIHNGSYVLYNDKARNTISLAFGVNDIEEGHFLNDVVSRKKQMITAIIDVIEGK